MFLHVVGHNQRFRVVHQSFRRSIETIYRHFHQVLYAVGELRNEMIKPPSTNIHPKILGSHRWNPYMQVTAHSTDKPLHNLDVIPCSYPTYTILLGLLVPLMALMCWQGCLDTCSKLSGVGNTTPHRM